MNETYFQTWNEDMAYILGFIVADGCVVCKNGLYQCIIVSKDVDVLEFIKGQVEYPHPIAKQKDGTSRLSLTRKQIVMDLMALGILPRKTWNLLMPKIPDGLFRSFALGYFDGDGSVYTTRQPRGRRNIKLMTEFICSSKEFLQVFGNKLKEETGYIPKIYSDNRSDNRFRMMSATHESLLLYHYFYDDSSSFYLTRKRARFEEWLGHQGNPRWGMIKCELCGTDFVRTHDKSKRCWSCRRGLRYSPSLMVT